MRVSISEFLDKALGLSSCSDPDRALLRGRFDALKGQLPWLYAMLTANLVGLHLAVRQEVSLSDLPVALMLTITGGRTAYWLRIRRRSFSDSAVKRQMRTIFVIALLFCTGACVWSLMVYSKLENHHRLDVTMFASLAALGCTYALSSYPQAARMPLLVLAIPMAAILATSSVSTHVGIGISLLILTAVTLRVLEGRDQVFRSLVSSRFQIEAEKQRAIDAERVAVAEKSRVGLIANSDALTGLANRRGFVRALDRLDAGEEGCWSLILIDLDGFKQINDTFGHNTGDAILIEVGRRLQTIEGLSGSVARLGGDEFAIVQACDNREVAMAIAEEAVERLSLPFMLLGQQMLVSACAGVSWHVGRDLTEAMRRADIALYEAKGAERGSIALFSEEMEQKVRRRTMIEQAVRAPGFAADVDLAFQPIFRLDTRELCSFEALARWRHSVLGWIPPSEFIPITEQISVVNEISDALLAKAAAAARDWPDSIRLSFNLSAVQICSASTADQVLSIIAGQGIEPSRLQIEVTETALLGDFEAARRNLSRLRNSGVRIALDDFGAGYSSISYLREINFDTVKLDGSLVSSIGEVGTSLPLLQGVLALCRAMGQQCVAEQVETDHQLKLLQALGCRYGQGYGLAAPMSASEAASLARRSSSSNAQFEGIRRVAESR